MKDNKIGSLSEKDIKVIYKDYFDHKDDGTVTKKFGTIVILDVLGWKNKATPKSIYQYVSLINNLKNTLLDKVMRTCNNIDESNINVTVLSDTILILINDEGPFFEINIFNILSDFLYRALTYNIVFRGVINRGEYYSNKLNNVFVGDSIYEAIASAEKTNWSGVILMDAWAKYILENNSLDTLKEIHLVSYSSIPYKGSGPFYKNLVVVPESLYKDVKYSKMVELYKNALKDVPDKLEETLKFLSEFATKFWL